MSTCPTPDLLRQFLADALPHAARAPVARHIDGCPACQQLLDRLTRPPPSSTAGPAEAEHEPALTRLLHQMRKTVPAAPGRSHSPLRFPGPPTPDGPLGQLGPYQVVRLLGRGATSLVYEALDARLDRVVAIKILRPERAPLASVRERFEREGRALAKLRHEHLVRVFDVQTPTDFPWYLVLEYVAGEPLSAWVDRDRKPRQVVQVVREAALGLAAAHQRGLVHRDVKPANILIDEQGRARVADFGLVLHPEGYDTLTVEGQVVGTPAYMSPEQARGDGHAVDARSDVWSLGVVLYELLTGQLPFRGNGRELLAAVVHDEPTRPRSLRRSLSRDLETIVLHCLEKEPARRYPSASELADDLERWLDGEAVQARPPHPFRQLGRWLLRHRVLLSLLLLGAGVLLAGSFAWWAHSGASEVRIRNALLRLETRATELLEEGDEAEGEKLLREAASQVEAQAARYPGLRAEGVRLYQKLAELLDDQDRLAEAEPYLQRALRLAEAWDQESPEPAARQAITTLLFRLMESAQERQPPGDWRGYLERYVAVETALVQAGTAEPDAIHHLVPACFRLAQLHRGDANNTEADRLEQQAEDLLARAARQARTPQERQEVVLLRARGLAERGDLPAVAQLAEQLKTTAGDDPQALYQAASCFSLCLTALQKQPHPPEASALREQYQRQALDLLRQAIRQGWSDPFLLIDEAWEPLRAHPQFRKLRRQIRSSMD